MKENSREIFYLSPDAEITDAEPESDELQSDLGEDISDETTLPIEAPLPAEVDKDSPLDDLSSLNANLSGLAKLIANVTEAYSVAIFTANIMDQTLSLSGAHTLSRDFIDDAKISFGCGLVGWTAENGVRISVCPFERDSSTLLYYSSDQDLKSFIAVPIHDSEDKLLGVISVDSKKSYAFSKVTEKILTDCTKQAAALIHLARNQNNNSPQVIERKQDLLAETLEELEIARFRRGLA